MPEISIILPTRQRARSVARLFQSIIDTTLDLDSLEVVLYLDEDDPESKDLGDIRLNIQKLVRHPGRTMGEITRECCAAARGRYFFLMNDDVVFKTRGWDRAVKEAFARSPDGIALVYGNDLDRGKSVPTFPVISRAALEAMGEICPAAYRNLYIDFHLLDVFEQLSCLGHQRVLYLEDVIFEHLHPVTGKAPLDETYRKKDIQADDYLFFALSENRKVAARQLSGAIEGARKVKALDPDSSLPVVSVVVPVTEEHFPKAHELLKSLWGLPRPQGRHEVLAFLGAECPREDEESLLFSYPGLKTFRLKGRVTFPRVLEAALESAPGELFVHLHPHARPVAGWLDALVAAARSCPEAGAIGARLVHSRNGKIVHAGVAFYSQDDGMGVRPTCLYRGFEPNHPAVLKARFLQAVSSACILLRKKALLDLDGFATRSLDSPAAALSICLALRERGCKILYTPEAKLVWVEPSGESEDGEIWFDKQSGNLLTALGHAPQCDLEEILREDGFSLGKEGRVFQIDKGTPP